MSYNKIGTFSLVQTSQHSGACGSTSSLPSASTSTFLWNSVHVQNFLSSRSWHLSKSVFVGVYNSQYSP